MTIKDIAKLSGYGVGTVSRVINNQPGVSARARESILAIIKEQNFEPNENARHLKRASSSSIAIIVKGTRNQMFAEIVIQLQSAFQVNGENTSVFYIDEDVNEAEFALRLSREQNPKAFVFLGVNREHFTENYAAIDAPGVIITNTSEGLALDNLSSVTTPDEEAAKKATEYLVSMGHRKIGIIGGHSKGSQISEKRIRGAKKGLSENGIEFDNALQYIPSRFTSEDGYNAANELLRRSPDVTAIFAIGDMIALGVIRAVVDGGKRVPDDISVIGFDGLNMGEFSVPRLTTIVQNLGALVKSGVDIIMQRLEYDYHAVNISAPFSLMERESVRRIERK